MNRSENTLVCFLFSDLFPWEKQGIDPLLQRMSGQPHFKLIHVTEAERGYFKKKCEGNYWIIARDWYQAVQFLKANSYHEGKIFISVIHASGEQRNLYSLVYKRLFPNLSEAFHLIVHSPLNQKYYSKIGGLTEKSISLLPMALPEIKNQNFESNASDFFEVGTFCDFSEESNINYFLSVAHYVVNRNPKVRFRVLGQGRLYAHFARTIQELGLAERVSVTETVEAEAIGLLDLFLYTPLRNQHFLPLLIAAASEIPVLSSEVLGIEDYVLDGKNGFVIGVNQIKPMGELVLRLAQDGLLRREMGRKLKMHLTESLAFERVFSAYEGLFYDLGNRDASVDKGNDERAA